MDGHDTGSVVGVESETMESQPAFITDKLPHQSMSVGNDQVTVHVSQNVVMVIDLNQP